MTVNTRKPTGMPPWPIIVLGGREKSGKTWAALQASTSNLVGTTYYIGIGEDDPDEYALIPGARFEIVLHDGSYRGILAAVQSVAAERTEKPNLLVIDSMTKLWDLIVDNAQRIANSRAKGRKTASGDYAISPDLWNVAANQWRVLMDAVRAHHGPAILTARLDEVMVMEDGQPTKEKTWKVQAHKSLVFDAGVVVEMHERGHALITGARSVRMAIEKPTEMPGLTIQELWSHLGITEKTEMGERSHASIVSDDPLTPEQEVALWRERAEKQTTEAGITAVWKEAQGLAQQNLLGTDALDAIREVAAKLKKGTPEPLTGAGTAAPKRAWLREARGMTTPEELRAHRAEAQAGGATPEVLEEIETLAASLEPPKTAEAPEWAETAPASEEWPVAPVPGTEPESAPAVSGLIDEAAF